jgi:hypothetical protein
MSELLTQPPLVPSPAHLSLPEILAQILRDLEAFAGPVPQPDDITLLVLANDEALGTVADSYGLGGT